MTCCKRCGNPIPRRKGGGKWCSPRCRRAASRARPAWQLADKQERVCPVCSQRFTSRRYSQLYCSRQCKWHALNARRINKLRKTVAKSRVSPQLAMRRAIALRPLWSIAPNLD